jgi:hypothetical protein
MIIPGDDPCTPCIDSQRQIYTVIEANLRKNGATAARGENERYFVVASFARNGRPAGSM